MSNGLREIHKKIIVEKAVRLFIEKGINNVTMTDIAKDIGVGEATLYRYFGRKQNIVLLGAVSLWDSLCHEYLSDSEGMNGYDKMESFYFAFLKAFQEKKDYFGFIYEFDNLLIEDKIDKDLLVEYDKILSTLEEVWVDIYTQGVTDKTIYYVQDPKLFYVATTQSLLNLCKKLARESTSLAADNSVNPEKEIELMIKIITSYFKR